MDEIDRTQQDLDCYEKHRRKELKQDAEETGECLWCGEPVESGRRWCGPECRDAWERDHNKLRKWR